MKKRCVPVLIGILFSLSLVAQKRTIIGFQLAAYLRTADPTALVDLFLQGSAEKVARIAEAHGGVVKMTMRNWCAVRMPAGRIAELNDELLVRSIEFEHSTGQTMNDSMRAKTGIDRIHQGFAPLVQAFDGEGVIMGVVDTGVDFNHPDLQDQLGNTRILQYWDQRYPVAVNTPQPFGYGQQWNQAQIDAGQCPTTDFDGGGHGTTVAGTAAGNGNASGHFIGAAPKSDMVIVATNFNAQNWPATVVDAVKYTFDKADELQRPAVVNLSVGDYLGSHDGLDPAALFIDSMLNAAPGRVVVAAAGNSGCFPNYQLHMEVDNDTSFAWFKTNSAGNNAFGGVPTAYIDFWADTADLNDVWYSIGADRVTGGYTYRGRIPFRNVQGTIDTEVADTLYSLSGNKLAMCYTLATVRGGQYHLEIMLPAPDSAAYYWRIMMTGNGRADAWSNNGFGISEIVSGTTNPVPPTAAQYPPMVDYVMPTLDRGIVDSWACSPHVITVANYNNEVIYTACDGNTVNVGGTEGNIAFCSSHGPTRTGLQKPDIAAPGDITMSAAPLSLIQNFQNGAGIFKLSWDCMHVRNGGTSIAAPAVAGAAALLLQKCPYLTHQEIIDLLNGHAFADSFTGTVPNNLYGYGKLDAFAAMIATNFEADITGPAEVCDGDSVLLQASPSAGTFIWDGASGGSFTYSQGGTTTLQVIDEQGCASTNVDSLFVTVEPVPQQPTIIVNGSALTCDVTAPNYQWYWNGSPVVGATDQQHDAEHTGSYTVEVSNGQCMKLSSPVFIALAGMESPVNEGGLVLWPSPAHEALSVSLENGNNAPYELLDAQGARVGSGMLKGRAVTRVPLDALAPGAYVLRAVLGQGEVRRAFLVR